MTSEKIKKNSFKSYYCTIKYFNWIVDPSHRSGYEPKGFGK